MSAPRHDHVVPVLLLDTLTGETARSPLPGTTKGGWNEWQLTEGSCSCDCNRFSHFDVDAPGGDLCVGSERFLVIEVDGKRDPEVVRLYNDSYPHGLVERFLVPEGLPLEVVLAFEFDPSSWPIYMDWAQDHGWPQKEAWLRLMLAGKRYNGGPARIINSKELVWLRDGKVASCDGCHRTREGVFYRIKGTSGLLRCDELVPLENA